jgi:hypothetical protein
MWHAYETQVVFNGNFSALTSAYGWSSPPIWAKGMSASGIYVLPPWEANAYEMAGFITVNFDSLSNRCGGGL